MQITITLQREGQAIHRNIRPSYLTDYNAIVADMIDSLEKVDKDTILQMIQDERIATRDLDAQDALKVLVDNF